MIEEKIIATDAKTPAEALAILEIAREDFYRFNVEGVSANLGDRFTLSAMDKALSVLRPLVRSAGVRNPTAT